MLSREIRFVVELLKHVEKDIYVVGAIEVEVRSWPKAIPRKCVLIERFPHGVIRDRAEMAGLGDAS